MHRVPLLQQELCQVAAVLAGDASQQRHLEARNTRSPGKWIGECKRWAEGRARPRATEVSPFAIHHPLEPAGASPLALGTTFTLMPPRQC